MNKLAQRIQELLQKAGPLVKEELVYVGDPKVPESYQELGKFTFKRLTFTELDQLRLVSVNSKGEFDKNLHAGANARTVAATLVDPDSGGVMYTVNDINEWPGYMVDAFAAASNRANTLSRKEVKGVAKNSEPTDGAKA
jgi:hypothetical protein